MSRLGGTASFTNNAGAYIGGTVTVNGPLGATVVNTGQVAGTTTLTPSSRRRTQGRLVNIGCYRCRNRYDHESQL